MHDFFDSVPASDLAQDLANPMPMRRGSVGERLMKCSKPGCACATGQEGRHGPYYSLTYAVEGKTKSRYLSAGQAAIARRQIETGKQFQQHVEAHWEACQHWADLELDGSQTAAATSEVVKKGGFKRASKKRLRRKSAS